MLIMGFTAIAHRRRPVLLVALLLAVVMGALSESNDRGGWLPVFRVWIGSTVVLILLIVLATLRYHPAVLVARPDVPAVAARPNPAAVLLTVVVLLQGAFLMSDSVSDIVDGQPLWGLSAAIVGMWVCVVAFQWRTAWGWFGVQLRPDGVYDRQPLGSLFTPWDASVREYPAASIGAQRVALYCDRPELVRLRGLRAGGLTVPAVSIDAAFLARAIQEYVSHPEYRSVIGTEDERRRMTAAITG